MDAHFFTLLMYKEVGEVSSPAVRSTRVDVEVSQEMAAYHG